MLKKRNQKGFTLIEIIAVLVILGILAAVAIPKYFDLQTVAKQKAIDGAIGAVQSTVAMEYSQGLLNSTYTATSGPPAATVTIGDFTGSYSAGANVTVTITGGPTGWNTSGTPTVSKVFSLR